MKKLIYILVFIGLFLSTCYSQIPWTQTYSNQKPTPLLRTIADTSYVRKLLHFEPYGRTGNAFDALARSGDIWLYGGLFRSKEMFDSARYSIYSAYADTATYARNGGGGDDLATAESLAVHRLNITNLTTSTPKLASENIYTGVNDFTANSAYFDSLSFVNSGTQYLWMNTSGYLYWGSSRLIDKTYGDAIYQPNYGFTPSANIISFLRSADYAAARTNLGLGTGSAVQFSQLALGAQGSSRGVLFFYNASTVYPTALVPGAPTNSISDTLPSTAGTLLNTSFSFLGDINGTPRSTVIGDGKVTRAKIDPSVRVGYRGLTGMLLVSKGVDSIDYANVLGTDLTGSEGTGVFVRSSAAHDAAQLTGTIPESSIPLTGIDAGTKNNPTLTVGTDGRIIAWSEGQPSGGSPSSFAGINGRAIFEASAVEDTLSLPGLVRSYYSVITHPIKSARGVVSTTYDELTAYPTRNYIYVTRVGANSGALEYEYIIFPDSLSPPSNLAMLLYETDSIACGWLAPVNSVGAVATVLDSVWLTYNDSGYIDALTAEEYALGDFPAEGVHTYGKHGFLSTVIKDTLFELVSEDTIYAQVWSRSKDDYTSDAIVSAQNLAATGSGVVVQPWNPANYTTATLIAQYDLMNDAHYGSINSGTKLTDYDIADESGNNNTLRDTVVGAVNSAPIFMRDKGVPYLLFRGQDNHVLYNKGGTVATLMASADSLHPKKFTIVAVMNDSCNRDSVGLRRAFSWTNTGSISGYGYDRFQFGYSMDSINKGSYSRFQLGYQRTVYDSSNYWRNGIPSKEITKYHYLTGADSNRVAFDSADGGVRPSILVWQEDYDSLYMKLNDASKLSGNSSTRAVAWTKGNLNDGLPGGIRDTCWRSHSNTFSLGNYMSGTAWGAQNTKPTFKLYELYIYSGTMSDAELDDLMYNIDERGKSIGRDTWYVRP